MFALFGTVGGLIAWAVIIGGITAAVYGFDLSRQHKGRDAQRAEDAPVMSICESLPQPTGLFAGKLKPADCAVTLRTGLTAIGANEKLKGDFRLLADERDACSRETARLGRIAARLQAEKDARKPTVEAKVAQIDIDKAELLVALGLPDPGGTCEQRLARRDAMWAKVREQRIRDFPPGPAPKSDGVTIKVPK